MNVVISDGMAIIPQERFYELLAAETRLDAVENLIRENKHYTMAAIADILFIERKDGNRNGQYL